MNLSYILQPLVEIGKIIKLYYPSDNSLGLYTADVLTKQLRLIRGAFFITSVYTETNNHFTVPRVDPDITLSDKGVIKNDVIISSLDEINSDMVLLLFVPSIARYVIIGSIINEQEIHFYDNVDSFSNFGETSFIQYKNGDTVLSKPGLSINIDNVGNIYLKSPTSEILITINGDISVNNINISQKTSDNIEILVGDTINITLNKEGKINIIANEASFIIDNNSNIVVKNNTGELVIDNKNGIISVNGETLIKLGKNASYSVARVGVDGVLGIPIMPIVGQPSKVISE